LLGEWGKRKSVKRGLVRGSFYFSRLWNKKWRFMDIGRWRADPRRNGTMNTWNLRTVPSRWHEPMNRWNRTFSRNPFDEARSSKIEARSMTDTNGYLACRHCQSI
jgi:hypothetical protein